MVQSIFKNKVIFYLASRYVTYAIQFITSLIIATKLGPYYMGIWGAVLLILNYFQQCHFGIAYSFPIFYIQEKNDSNTCYLYALNSIILIGILCLIVFFTYFCYPFVCSSFFDKYHINNYYVWICIIAALHYYQEFFLQLFRVQNKIMLVAICQSIVIILNFVCIFIFEKEDLIIALMAGYLLGYLLCCMMAVLSKDFFHILKAKPSLRIQLLILKKGWYLFVYGACFYFIIISIRTIISSFYSVEEFGLFTFSYTIANAFLLLLGAISFLITPKLLAKLSSNDKDEIIETIKSLRIIMVTSSHFIIYLAITVFPVFLYFIPKYDNSITSLNLIALTILMNSNVTGYSELLLANNQEKRLSQLSFVALLSNCLLGLFFVKVAHFRFDLVIIATMISYLLYSLLVVTTGETCIHKVRFWHVISSWFPYRLAIPYFTAVVISIMNFRGYYNIIPLFLFCLFNLSSYNSIKMAILRIVRKPEVVNV